jgi:hypothetical protein
MAKEVNIDTILDDLSYCGGTGGWDKHYLETNYIKPWLHSYLFN